MEPKCAVPCPGYCDLFKNTRINVDGEIKCRVNLQINYLATILSRYRDIFQDYFLTLIHYSSHGVWSRSLIRRRYVWLSIEVRDWSPWIIGQVNCRTTDCYILRGKCNRSTKIEDAHWNSITIRRHVTFLLKRDSIRQRGFQRWKGFTLGPVHM